MDMIGYLHGAACSPVFLGGLRAPSWRGQKMSTDLEGIITLERGPLTHTAKWRVRGNTLIVYFGADNEAVLLGSFEREPDILARMVLAELVERREKAWKLL
jgi:hypothetical protein